MAPPPEYIWDNVYLWDWARNVSFGNFAALVADSHHHMRWGNWGFAAVLIQFFGDDVTVYYLTTIIPSTLGAVLFIYFAWRHIGTWAALIFCLLWFFDAELFRATFQLLPSGQSLLPCAVLLLLLTHVAKLERISTQLALLIALAIFWLYGVKETYLALAPAAAWIMWRIGGIRPLLILSLVMVAGYVAETLMFRFMNDEFSLLGRVHALVDGGQHVTIMLTNEHYVAQQTRYFDAGITMRWVAAVGVSSAVYFPAFLLAVLVMVDRQRSLDQGASTQYTALQIVVLMLLSFMFFTTFFIISVSPLRLGHGLVSRYLAICLPLCYLLLIGFTAAQLKGSRLRYRLAAIAIIPFFISPAINRFMEYPDLGISEISERYREFGVAIESFNCIRGRQRSIVRNQIEMVPVAHRGPNLNAMLASEEIEQQGRWFLIRGGVTECENTYTISRIATARY